MGEKEVIEKTVRPVTFDIIVDGLRAIGVKEGTVLLVHSSFSSLGWVNSGADTVILALEKVLGENGTLVMPAHSGNLSDPSRWVNPPVPRVWWDTIKDTMLPFDPILTPTRGLGIIPEVFRKGNGVLRSDHPHVSFTAKGKYAEQITEGHSLEFGLGMDSPLGKIYSLGGYVLLLGVDHDVNTSLHLSEFLSDYPGKKTYKNYAPVIKDGKRVWTSFDDVDDDTSDFKEVGKAFIRAKNNIISLGKIGQADSQFFRQKDLVDFAVKWFKENRS